MRLHKVVWVAAVVVLVAGILIVAVIYSLFLTSEVTFRGQQFAYFYIKTGSSYHLVRQVLADQQLVKRQWAFHILATLTKYDQNIKPGRYKITHGMSIYKLVMLLNSGSQEPVRVTFNNIRTPAQLAGRLARQLEPDSITLMDAFTDSVFLSQFDLQVGDLPLIFIPNTYELYWNTTPEGLFRRLKKEAGRFWNSERQQKLTKLGFDTKQAVILASIIEMETNRDSEKPRIAGVYINRLRIGMPLQADPTLVFAIGDFTIKRVLNIHKEIDSPYNTYKYAGLPPGPICFPSVSSVDAVLNFEQHDYLYFCASDDLSGFHVFARTYNDHLQNARRYQRALNRSGIY